MVDQKKTDRVCWYEPLVISIRMVKFTCFRSFATLNLPLLGCILFHETLYQKANDGVPFVKHLQQNGVVPGIKVSLPYSVAHNYFTAWPVIG